MTAQILTDIEESPEGRAGLGYDVDRVSLFEQATSQICADKTRGASDKDPYQDKYSSSIRIRK